MGEDGKRDMKLFGGWEWYLGRLCDYRKREDLSGLRERWRESEKQLSKSEAE